jgi:hypothetical protein
MSNETDLSPIIGEIYWYGYTVLKSRVAKIPVTSQNSKVFQKSSWWIPDLLLKTWVFWASYSHFPTLIRVCYLYVL